MPEINAHLLRNIMKREKVSAETLSKWCKVSPLSFRRMLRNEINMDIEIFAGALEQLGYKIIVVKKEDVV